MTDDEILTVIVAAVREETDNPLQHIDGGMTAANISGWDSLAHTRIMMNIESRIGIEIDIDATYRAATIADLVAVVRSSIAT